jgi:hypothetical protein
MKKKRQSKTIYRINLARRDSLIQWIIAHIGITENSNILNIVAMIKLPKA